MPDQEPLGQTTRDTMNRVKAEWINDYRIKLRKLMEGLSNPKPTSDFGKGYNACLDDCLAFLEE